MTFKQIFLFVIFAFVGDALKWNNCGGNSAVRIEDVTLSPQPLSLRKGAKVTFGGKFVVTGDTGTNYKINVNLKRHLGWFGWTTVPCFGKCSQNIACDQMINLLEGERCPLEQKEYVIEPRTITLPDVPLPSFLKSGRYRVTADLRDRANNNRIACMEAELEITG